MQGLTRLPVTTAGVVVASLGAATYLAGWVLGWIEMTTAAAACLLALTSAMLFVIGRLRLRTSRSMSADRVIAGELVTATLTVANERSMRTRPLRLEETLPSGAKRFVVPALQRGEITTYSYEVPTEQRGVLAVGPAMLTRTDPLHLLRRQAVQRGADRLWVHPKHRPLPPMPAGFAKDLEGPTTDSSPDGDVAFHTLRDYEPGDDYRHIHWMSTARAGRPIVRHYVDNRRPELLVILDTDRAAMTGPAFEVAVQIVASIGVSAFLHNEPISVWLDGGPMLGRTRPGGRQDLLDQLSLVDQHGSVAATSPAADAATATTTSAAASPAGHIDRLVDATLLAIRTEPGPSAVVLVTGAAQPEDLVAYSTRVNRHAKVVVTRVWPADEVIFGRVPGATVLDVDSLVAFQRFWTDVLT